MGFKNFSARMKYFKLRKKFISKFVEHKCFYCGIKLVEYDYPCSRQEALTIDHLKPRAMGGDPFSFSNFRLSCYRCNQIRGKIQCLGLDKKYAQLLRYIKGKTIVFPDEFFHYIFYSPLPEFDLTKAQ